MREIIFLVSGYGGTLRYVQEAKKFLKLSYSIVQVVADRECGAIEYAKEQNISFSVLKYNRSNSKEFDLILKSYPKALVVTNIHKILSANTLNVGCEFINLHYALLPSFGGLIGMDPVDEAHKCNSQFIGSTCHELVEEVDAGKIISQSIFKPNWAAKDLVYDTIFQSGCLNLMSCILDNKGEGIFEINGHRVELSKPINYTLEAHKNIMVKVIESI